MFVRSRDHSFSAWLSLNRQLAIWTPFGLWNPSICVSNWMTFTRLGRFVDGLVFSSIRRNRSRKFVDSPTVFSFRQFVVSRTGSFLCVFTKYSRYQWTCMILHNFWVNRHSKRMLFLKNPVISASKWFSIKVVLSFIAFFTVSSFTQCLFLWVCVLCVCVWVRLHSRIMQIMHIFFVQLLCSERRHFRLDNPMAPSTNRRHSPISNQKKKHEEKNTNKKANCPAPMRDNEMWYLRSMACRSRATTRLVLWSIIKRNPIDIMWKDNLRQWIFMAGWIKQHIKMHRELRGKFVLSHFIRDECNRLEKIKCCRKREKRKNLW